MTPDDRINGINQAQTYDDLHDAMRGFLDEAEARYPALSQAAALRACIGGGAFAEGLQCLKDYQTLTGNAYHDAHRVIEAAAVKEVQLGGVPPPP
ncbi:hypothetical protein [Paraburkholderia sp. J12]|uniref:hypothetical protein n=1 Tax=Paraburkholderia sp. J12 TaxID=2805432 RepID=UPI002ABDB476|nr:hypothetical protein [Paraburkholderia sp. J12]